MSAFGTKRTFRSGHAVANSLNEGTSSHCRPKAQGCADYALEWRDYSRDLRPAEWGPNVILRGNNPQDRMSALGQKQTSPHFQSMSALPPIADIETPPAKCPLCAKSGHAQQRKRRTISFYSFYRCDSVRSECAAARSRVPV